MFLSMKSIIALKRNSKYFAITMTASKSKHLKDFLMHRVSDVRFLGQRVIPGSLSVTSLSSRFWIRGSPPSRAL